MAHDMNKLLDVALQQDASDIHLTVGRPPSFRISGEIKSLNTAPLTPEDTASLMKQITSERGQRELAELGSTDFAIGFFRQSSLPGQRLQTTWPQRHGVAENSVRNHCP